MKTHQFNSLVSESIYILFFTLHVSRFSTHWRHILALRSANWRATSLLILKVLRLSLEIVSEYDKKIPLSQTADKPMASRGRATQQS